LQLHDLSSQFYLTEADFGKNRAEASCAQLAELNSYVRTVSHTGPLTDEFLRQFRVVVLTNSDAEEQQRIGKFAHENGIALIIAETRGLFAKVFCDFGDNFTIYDQDGTQPVSTMVASSNLWGMCVGAKKKKSIIFQADAGNAREGSLSSPGLR